MYVPKIRYMHFFVIILNIYGIYVDVTNGFFYEKIKMQEKYKHKYKYREEML